MGSVFWDVTPYNLTEYVSESPAYSEDGSANSSETMVTSYQNIQRHIAEARNLQQNFIIKKLITHTMEKMLLPSMVVHSRHY
jgi:hypothetical protein